MTKSRGLKKGKGVEYQPGSELLKDKGMRENNALT